MTQIADRPSTKQAASQPGGVGAPGRAKIAERTLRKDKWWGTPRLYVILLTAWLAYGVVRAATQSNFFVPLYGYITPFASPCIANQCADVEVTLFNGTVSSGSAAELGTWLGNFPPLLPFAILTLPFLLLFRMTCYYYRRAYYRSFWRSPAACAVAEPHAKYTGETRFPLIIQNAHRYFVYVAILISILNTYSAVISFMPHTVLADGVAAEGPRHFGFGLGSLILTANVVFLWGYTIGCHACRHIVAGRLNNFSKHPLRYRMWGLVTKLNNKHMQLAWTTLGTLVITDLYIALVAGGVIPDLRFVN
jgi:hypothetical protein